MSNQKPFNNIQPRWMNVQDTAIYSGVSPRLVELWVKDKCVFSSLVQRPGTQKGRRLIDRESVDAFLLKGASNRAKLSMNAKPKQNKGDVQE